MKYLYQWEIRQYKYFLLFFCQISVLKTTEKGGPQSGAPASRHTRRPNGNHLPRGVHYTVNLPGPRPLI